MPYRKIILSHTEEHANYPFGIKQRNSKLTNKILVLLIMSEAQLQPQTLGLILSKTQDFPG